MLTDRTYASGKSVAVLVGIALGADDDSESPTRVPQRCACKLLAVALPRQDDEDTSRAAANASGHHCTHWRVAPPCETWARMEAPTA